MSTVNDVGADRRFLDSSLPEWASQIDADKLDCSGQRHIFVCKKHQIIANGPHDQIAAQNAEINPGFKAGLPG